MASNEETINPSEVVAGRTRLESVFRSYDLEMIVHLLKTSRLSREGSTPELIDLLVKFDLRRTFGAEAAPWDIASDNDPSRGSLVPSLDYHESFEEVTARTGMGEVPHEEDPAFNSTVMENSEQATHTATVVSTVTTVTNSSLASSTVSTYSTGLPPRAYESFYKGFSSRLNQARSVMSTSISLNQSP